MVLAAFFFGMLTLFAAYQRTWWLIAPQGILCVVFIALAAIT